MLAAYADAKMLPRIATPSAPPTCRVVSFIAEPSPALASGSEPMMDSVAGTIAVPIPNPRITSDTTTCAYPDAVVSVPMNHSPPATIVIPAATRVLLPNRPVSRPDAGALIISTSASGATRMPASRAEYPRTNWRYWVRKNSDPKSAKKTRTIDTLAAVNRGFSKNVTSSIGWSLRSSHTVNVTSTTAVNAKVASVCVEVHPCDGASMIP